MLGAFFLPRFHPRYAFRATFDCRRRSRWLKFSCCRCLIPSGISLARSACIPGTSPGMDSRGFSKWPVQDVAPIDCAGKESPGQRAGRAEGSASCFCAPRLARGAAKIWVRIVPMKRPPGGAPFGRPFQIAISPVHGSRVLSQRERKDRVRQQGGWRRITTWRRDVLGASRHRLLSRARAASASEKAGASLSKDSSSFRARAFSPFCARAMARW